MVNYLSTPSSEAWKYVNDTTLAEMVPWVGQVVVEERNTSLI